jgi:putative ABC transport system permease protein
LALGVFAIAAAGSTQQAVREGLRNDGQVLLGGDLELRLTYRTLESDQQAALEDHGTVTHGQELRAMARRGSGTELRQSLVELKTVDGAYPLFGSIALSDPQGQPITLAQSLSLGPDGLWGVVVERSLLSRLGVALGDEIQVGEARLRITALIEREPDRVATVITFGPRLMMTGQALAATDLLQPGALVQDVTRLRITDGSTPAALAASLKERFPDAGWRVRMVDEAAPGLQRFLTQVATYLTLVGLTALLVGGLGVANAVRAYLDGRLSTIATLKSLGASAPQVFAIYLIQVALLASVGVVLGCVAGAVVPWLAAPVLSSMLPFDLPVGIYPLPLLIAAAFGLLTALVFGLPPLIQSRKTPAAWLFRTAALGSEDEDKDRAVLTPGAASSSPLWALQGVAITALIALVMVTSDRMGLAVGFVVGSILALGLFRLAARGVMILSRRLAATPGVVRGRPGLRLALANLHRPGSQTQSLVVSLGLGLSVLVTVALIEANLNRQIGERLPEEGPAFYFIDIQDHQRDAFAQAIASVPGARVLNTADMVRGRVVALRGQLVDPESVDPDSRWAVRGDRGLTTAATQPDNAKVVAGAWWPEDYSGPPLVSVAANIAKGLKLEVGDSITLNVLGRDITAEVANLREVDWSTLSMNFAFVVTPGTLAGAPRTWIATVTVPESAEQAVERAVVDVAPNISAIGVRQLLSSFNSVLQQAGLAVRASAALTVLAGALVLGGAMAAGHRRRVYEAVVLKVLGAQRRTVMGTHLAEYALLGLISGLLAVCVGGTAAWAVLRFVMRADWVFLPQVAGVVLVGSVVLVGAVGLWATWQALSAKASPLLRQD